MTKHTSGLFLAIAFYCISLPISGDGVLLAQETPSSREKALKLDLEEAIQMIQQKKLMLLQMDFLSPRTPMNFSSRRGPSTLENSRLAQLTGVLQAALKAKPTFNRTRTLAQIDCVIEPTKQVEETLAAQPDLYGKVEGPVEGFGSNFSNAMFAAAGTLDSGNLEKFVRGMYPLQELARVTKGDQLKRLLFRLTQNPEMAKTMTKDLQLVANSKDVTVRKTADGKTSVATVRLPPTTRDGKPREFRFELVDGNWRLFDSLREARAEHTKLLAAPVAGYTIPGQQVTLMMQWSDDSWRLIGEPMARQITVD